MAKQSKALVGGNIFSKIFKGLKKAIKVLKPVQRLAPALIPGPVGSIVGKVGEQLGVGHRRRRVRRVVGGAKKRRVPRVRSTALRL